MNLSLGTRTVLIICYFVQGFVALRLLKVSIPSYKLRGESVFLECQYELDKVRDMSLINSYSPNRDNEPDNSRDDGWTVHRRMRVYQSQANSQLQRHQRQTYYQSSIGTNQQKKYEQERAQNQNLYMQQHPSYYAEKNEQRKVYHHQQPQPELTPNQQLYTYPYQTPTSPYGHSIYRGRSSTSVHDVVGVNLYNANTYRGWGESSRSVSSFGQMERDNSFADSTEHDDEEDKEEDNEEEEGEALYAIKWYKDNEEFYRYVPKAKPPKTSYRVDGVRVIEEHSDSSRVLLRGLTINSTGLYRCEISAEAPNFSSVEAEGHMDVVYLPRDGPYIRGQQPQYQIGETLDLNCTSGKSHPASHLQWFINDEAVVEKLNLIKYNDTIHRHGLITTTLGLEKMVEAENFHKGAMRVKCVASLSPVLWKGDKESVLQRRRPGLIDNREAMLLVHSSAPRHNKIDGSLALFIALTITAFPRAFHRLSLLPTLL
uniref:Ig-like domain-containing protein n=1 Tax=Glossina pallidipes TaxID=7398 RepID=A0A1A9ZZA6_GLOPL